MQAPVVTAADIFAGAGVGAVGYGAGGLRVAYAVDSWPLACATHGMNAPGTLVECRDVRGLSGREVAEACGRTPDVLLLSPPCVDWTTNGPMRPDGANALLYDEAVRLVGELRPPAFLIENVPGLAEVSRNRARFLAYVEALRGHGYAVASRMLEAWRLGVPQTRRRLVVVGFQADLGLDPRRAFPLRGPVAAIRDVMPDAAGVVALPALHYGQLRPRRAWDASGPAGTGHRWRHGGAAARGPAGRRPGGRPARDDIGRRARPPDGSRLVPVPAGRVRGAAVDDDRERGADATRGGGRAVGRRCAGRATVTVDDPTPRDPVRDPRVGQLTGSLRFTSDFASDAIMKLRGELLLARR
jgi:site-specific DNA-cytosine methylase